MRCPLWRPSAHPSVTVHANGELKPQRAVTVSVGLAELGPDLSPEKVVDGADRALYAAKAAGRDAIYIYRVGTPVGLEDLTQG